MKTATTKRKAIADAVEFLKEESPNAPGNIAGVQLIPLEKVRAFKDHPACMKGNAWTTWFRDLRCRCHP